MGESEVSFQLTLPWPPTALSPNTANTWRKRLLAKKKYKTDCYLLAKAAGRPVVGEGNIPMCVLFYPPRKNRDIDNCLAQIKAGLDGIAEAWGLNDRMFYPITLDWGGTHPQGEVVVII